MSHLRINELKKDLRQFPREVLDFNREKLNSIILQTVETIDLMLNYEIYDISIKDLQNYLVLAVELCQELIDLFDNLIGQTKQTLETSVKTKAEDYYLHLKYKIEDNIDQLTKTRMWKEYEEKMIRSQSNIFSDYVLFLGRLNNCKLLGTQIKSIQSLETISKITILIRDAIATNFDRLYSLVFLLESCSKLLHEKTEISFINQNQTITSNDVQMDLDGIINITRLEWLEPLHKEIETDLAHEDKHLLHLIFAKRLYQLSRDPKEMFLWTMSYLASESKDPELIRLSFKVANLSSILLTVSSKLEKFTSMDRVDKIRKIEALEFEDAINDLAEMYQVKDIRIDHMRRALLTKLEKLKTLLLEISHFDEIAEEIVVMFQFDTTMQDEVTYENLSYILSSY